jgi:hypothetical protein
MGVTIITKENSSSSPFRKSKLLEKRDNAGKIPKRKG